MSAKMNVPELRFKEFSGEWEEKRLGDIANIKTGPFGSTLHQEDYVDEGTPIITVEHLGEYGITKQNLPLVSDKDKARLKSYILDDGDIVFSRVGSVDRSALISETESGWLFSGRLLRVKISSKNYVPLFLNQLFRNEYVKHRIRSVAVGQTMPSLNTEILKNFHLYFPKNELEQQKIASFLNLVDTKIEQLTKKKTLLEQYKKGVMQKIFSQELRFRDDDGGEYPEWVEKKLGEIFNFLRGSSLSKADITEHGLNKCIHYGELFTTYKEKISNIKSSTNLAEGQFSKIGDILMPSSDVTPQGLATASAIFEDNVIVGGDTNILRPKKSLDSLFVSYFLNSNKNEIMKAVTGTTVKHIYNKDVAKLKIHMPTLKEQTKIANFLTSIDIKISQIGQQLEAAKQFKKALLQKMFV